MQTSKMKHISKLSAFIGGTILAGGMLLSSCTDSFESLNIDPNGVTDEEMNRDNLRTGSYFSQMQRNVFHLGDGQGAEYQIVQMLCGDIFASYFADTKGSYDNVGNRHHDHYSMQSHWYNKPFARAYTDIMQPWLEIVKVTEDGAIDRELATVVKVLAMSRITDKYGPIPYSKFGTGIQIPYDSQEEVYNQFFSELDEAITTLTNYQASNGKPYMAKYDLIYGGNIANWIKLANTLRLRLAMRISYVNESKARAEIQKALDAGQFIATTSEEPVIGQSANFSFENPIWQVTNDWNDLHMSATMDCYLNGYSDPRLAAYFKPAVSSGEYHGMRNGMTSSVSSYKELTSGANFEKTSSITWMHAAETFFLQAEAKLRFDLGTASVGDLYNEGIRKSFESAGVSGADAYLANNTAVPLTQWTDPRTNRGTAVEDMLSNLTVAWDDDADADTKLERIMVQKWIALYPDGQEAWSEMRRTGYPGWVYINSYSNGATTAGVQNNQLISRIPFPTTEYSDNNANTTAAVQLLGGQDNAGTRLWWDVKR